jgi:hypothetical protein
MSLTNLGVQKRLLLLDALEAGGVDDWDGYDEARMIGLRGNLVVQGGEGGQKLAILIV